MIDKKAKLCHCGEWRGNYFLGGFLFSGLLAVALIMALIAFVIELGDWVR